MNQNEQVNDEDSGETLLRIYMKHPDKFIGIDNDTPLYNPNRKESRPSLTKLQRLLNRPQSADANRHASAPGKLSVTKDLPVRNTFRRKESTKSTTLRSLSPLSTSASTDSDITKWLTAGNCNSARDTEKAQIRKIFQTPTPSSPLIAEREANAATISSIEGGTPRTSNKRVVNKNFQRLSSANNSRGETIRSQKVTDSYSSRMNTKLPVPNRRSASAIEKTQYSITSPTPTRDRNDSGSATQEIKFGAWDNKKEEVVFLKKDQRGLRASDSESDEGKLSDVTMKARKPPVRRMDGQSSKFEATVSRRHGSVNISVATEEHGKRQTDKQFRQTPSQLPKLPCGVRQPPFR